MANRTRAALSHCFAWAMQNGLAERNPVVGTARPAPEMRRDRVLSEAELRAVWSATGDGTFGRIVKLLILTGQRCREIGDMRWEEVDRRRGLFTLPAGRAKNGRQHELPLAPAAMALILGDRADPPASGIVFGRVTSKAGFSG
jgi:integrase